MHYHGRPADTTPTCATAVFARFRTDNQALSVLPQQLLYVLLQLVALGVALYKCSVMGLLPSLADLMADTAVLQVRRERRGSHRHLSNCI